MKKSLIVLTVLAFSIPAAAEKIEAFVKADTYELFVPTVQAVKKEMESGGKFEFIAQADKTAAIDDLDAMTALLKKYGSVSAMKMQEKVSLFNLQEHLNGILTHSSSDRLVCTRGVNTGSHIQKTSCSTYGDIQREKRLLKDVTDQWLRNTPQGNISPCPNPSMCSGH